MNMSVCSANTLELETIFQETILDQVFPCSGTETKLKEIYACSNALEKSRNSKNIPL